MIPDGRLTRGTFWKRPEWAQCSKCGGPVYGVSLDEPYSETARDENGNRLASGEVVLTVECHGETWSWSSRRGGRWPVDWLEQPLGKRIEHLSCDHQTLFVLSADGKTLTMKEKALDEEALRRGGQDYCWKTVADFVRR